MSSLFYGRSDFNSDISLWDVSSVTDMDSMFRAAFSFNQDIITFIVTDIKVNIINDKNKKKIKKYLISNSKKLFK